MVIEKSKAELTTELLEELFKTHGLESEIYENWVIPNGSDYAMKGYWYPKATENTGQLTIEIFVNSETIMVESFSGQGGSNQERLKQAFSSFVYHDFLVLLKAIWGRDSHEIKVEVWEIAEEKFDVYIGEYGVVNYDKTKELNLPNSYLERMKELIINDTLVDKFHWFTFFYANLNGLDNYAEILKDNQKLIDNANRFKKLNWQRSNSYYAVRQFVILKKIEA
jgi:hypothetical protein